MLRYACKTSLCQFLATPFFYNSLINKIISSFFATICKFSTIVWLGFFDEVLWAHIFFNVIFSVERTGCGEYESWFRKWQRSKALSKPSAYNQVLFHKTCGYVFLHKNFYQFVNKQIISSFFATILKIFDKHYHAELDSASSKIL